VLNESPTHLHELEERASATYNHTYETNLSEEDGTGDRLNSINQKPSSNKNN